MVATGTEAATGLALMAAPALVVRLLFGEDLSGAGLVVGRLAGMGLFSLALACWPSPSPTLPALRAMFIYNALVAAFLAYLLLAGTSYGALLIGVTVVHVVFATWLALAWSKFRTIATIQN